LEDEEMSGAIKIGIAEDDLAFVETLSQYIASQPGLEVCWIANNGNDAIKDLSRHNVDLIILDIMMPHLDGIGVLERIRTMNLQPVPRVIVLTALGKEETVRRALSLGADYYILKPFDMAALVRRIRQCAGDMPVARPRGIVAARQLDDREIEVSRVLTWLGLSPHVKGFKYLTDAIQMALDQPHIRGRVTTELYPAVASINSTTPQRVERAIRHAVGLIWRKGEQANVQALFSHCVSSRKQPTNSEFIARISESIRLGQV